MSAFWQAVIAHWQSLGLGSGVLIFAIIACWPEKIPACAQDWWTWARSSFQTAIPTRVHPSTQPPTTPTEPTKE